MHDLDALAQAAEALGDGRETVAVGLPLVLVPAAADAHLRTTTRDRVDGGGDLREIGRVAVAHAGAHLAEAHAVGRRGERGHERPRLVGGLAAGNRGGVEVVVDPQRGPGAVVGALGERVHDAPVFGGVDADEVEPPALGDEDAEVHGLTLGVGADVGGRGSRTGRGGTGRRLRAGGPGGAANSAMRKAVGGWARGVGRVGRDTCTGRMPDTPLHGGRPGSTATTHSARERLQALVHHGHGIRVVVDEHGVAAERGGDRAEVPLPANMSSTRSPGRLEACTMRRSTPSGFCVG